MVEEQEESRQKRTRRVTKHALTDVGLETLLQVLKSYVIGTKNGEFPIDYQQVATISGLNGPLVSGCNKFFLENGMLEFRKRGLYVPTQEIVNFSRSLPWDVESAKRSLRNVLERTWFCELLRNRFALKSIYKEAELISSLGRETGALADQKMSLKRILDLLEYAEIIQKKDDSDEYMLATSSGALDAALPVLKVDAKGRELESEMSSSEARNMYLGSMRCQINLNITVPENVSDDYIQSLENLLRKLSHLTDEK